MILETKHILFLFNTCLVLILVAFEYISFATIISWYLSKDHFFIFFYSVNCMEELCFLPHLFIYPIIDLHQCGVALLLIPIKSCYLGK